MNGLRILLVRAARDGDPLQTALAESGCSVLNHPVIAIKPQPDDDPAVKRVILDIDHYRKVISVSRHAASLGAQWLDRYWPQQPAGIQWIAVGKATAEVLGSWGIDAIWPSSDPSTEGLLAMDSLRHVEGERIAIFRGVGGRETLAQCLRERGAAVDYCELYRRERDETHRDDIHREIERGIDAVLVHSVDILENLLAVVSDADHEALVRLPVIVPGRRVEEAACSRGFSTVVRAESALADAMVAALGHWYTHNRTN